MENREIAIRLSGVKKTYRLGRIGGGTLRADLQSWWARVRGLDDPNTKIGQKRTGGTFPALDGIDLTIYKGETLGIIGRNGAGKSTLLKLLSRVTAPSAGDIHIYGRVASMLEVGTGFHGEMTGRENVYLNGAILGMTREEIDAKMADIIAFSEVGEFIDTPVKRYSSGMYVKLAFAVAAHLDSEIMIMDEVLAVGDMAFQKKCLDRMRQAAKQEGRTVLYVSHNMHTVRRLCQRCVVLDRGKIAFCGDVEQAIAIYLGTEKELSLKNHCRDLPREEICDGAVRMTLIEILDRDTPVIYDRESLDVKITFDASRDYAQLRFRMILFSQAHNPVGMLTAEAPIPAGTGENSVTLTFSLDALAPGTYTGRMVLYEENAYGGEAIHDVVDPGITFRKEPGEKADGTARFWKPHAWGYVRFPDGRVRSEKN